MEQKKFDHKKIVALVEGAIMVALAFVLSLVTLYKMPWGGRVTLLSMLPIVVYSLKNGVKYGLMASFVFALIQLLQGIIEDGVLGWGLTPVMLIGCIALDYILPFTALGLAGIFRKLGSKGTVLGTAFVLLLRLVSHVISGAVIFHSVGLLWDRFETNNPWVYSLGYNAVYMVPEIVLTSIGAFALFKIPYFKKALLSANDEGVKAAN